MSANSKSKIQNPQRYKLLLLLLLCALLCAPGRALAQEPPLVIPQGQQIQGDVSSTGRSLLIEGEVLGDVTSWNGEITVRGHVHGDVVSYGGSIALEPGARVDGHVLTLAGAVEHATTARIAGQMIGGDGAVGGRAVAGLVSLINPRPTEAGGTSQGLGVLALALAALLPALAAALFWPRRSAGAARTLQFMPWRSAGLGLLSTALLAALLPPLAALLAISLVGLPLVLALLLLVQIPYIGGLATLAYTLGQRLPSASTARSPLAAMALGALLLLLPLAVLGIYAFAWSAVLFYLLASPGLGALILSRGGAFAPSAVTR